MEKGGGVKASGVVTGVSLMGWLHVSVSAVSVEQRAGKKLASSHQGTLQFPSASRRHRMHAKGMVEVLVHGTQAGNDVCD